MTLFSADIAHFLATYFNVHRYPPTEQGGLYKRSNRPVRRLGLALEPGPALTNWVVGQQVDALWVHRPWQLAPDALPSDVSVLYNHLPFDETLTMGFNQPLANQLGLTAVEPIGYKQTEALPARAIGTIGDLPSRTFMNWCHWVEQAFGGYDQTVPGRADLLNRVAVVGAMNDQLILEAAKRGASLYLTGQYRKSAQKAVDETGMAVIAVGHRRSEEWGLHTLASILHIHYPELAVLTFLPDKAP